MTTSKTTTRKGEVINVVDGSRDGLTKAWARRWGRMVKAWRAEDGRKTQDGERQPTGKGEGKHTALSRWRRQRAQLGGTAGQGCGGARVEPPGYPTTGASRDSLPTRRSKHLPPHVTRYPSTQVSSISVPAGVHSPAAQSHVTAPFNCRYAGILRTALPSTPNNLSALHAPTPYHTMCYTALNRQAKCTWKAGG